MNGKTISIILLIFALIVSSSYSQQKAEWKGKIEYEDGVKIIKNPQEPLFGELVLDLEAIFTLGTEKDENDIFSYIWDVQIDSKGNVFVSDVKTRRIKKFGSDGKYLYDIGRMGQGPGEFQGARHIYVDDSSGDIYLADFMKVHRYNNAGQFQSSISMKRYFRRFFIGADKSFWGMAAFFDETGKGEAFEKVSSQGELQKRIKTFSPMDTGTTKPVGEGEVIATSGPKHGYEYELIVSKIDEQTSLWAMSHKYEMNVIDVEGNLLFKIRKQETPQKFSGREKDEILSRFNIKARKKVVFPRFKPFFKNIISDGEGRFYVQRIRSPIASKEACDYDIFGRNGHYLYRAHCVEDPIAIKNGFFCSIVRDTETDIQTVRLYRIKNWNQIEKNISQ